MSYNADLEEEAFNESHTTIGQPRGLVNNGNYCYQNSILQMLIGTPRNAIFSKDASEIINDDVCILIMIQCT